MSALPVEDFTHQLIEAYSSPLFKRVAESGEDGVNVASRLYRELSTALPENDRSKWGKLLEYNTFLVEASFLLSRLEQIKTNPKRKIAPKEVRRSLQHRLKEISKRLELFKHTNQVELTDLTTLGNGQMQELLAIQNKVFENMSKALVEKPAKKRFFSYESVWGNPIVGRSAKIAEITLGWTNRLMRYINSTRVPVPASGAHQAANATAAAAPPQVPQPPSSAPKLSSPANLSTGLNLAATAASLIIVVPNVINFMVQIVKKMHIAATLKKKIKGVRAERQLVEVKIRQMQEELINLRAQGLSSDWVHHIAQERDRLILEQEQLTAKEANLEKMLKKKPIGLLVMTFFLASGLTDMTGRILDVVTTASGAGAKISTTTMAGIAGASQILGPIIAAFQVVISGGFLTINSKELHQAKEAYRDLEKKFEALEEKVHPERLAIQQKMQQIRAKLALKKITKENRQQLEQSLEELKGKYEAIKPDLFQQFYELERNKLQIELLATKRKIGLLRISVATFSLLTTAGIVGFVGAVSAPAVPVGLGLTGISLTLVAISLVLAIVHKMKEKRSAKQLMIKQAPYRFKDAQEQEAAIRELVELMYTTTYVKDEVEKQQKIKELIEHLESRTGSVGNRALMEEALKDYFKGLLSDKS